MVDPKRHLPPSLQGRGFRGFMHHFPVWVRIICAVVMLCLGMIGAQLVYGATSRALPFSLIEGAAVGGKSAAEVAGVVQALYADTELTITVHDKRTATALVKTGLSPDVDQAAQQVVDYPLWQRFAPFSLFKNIGATKHVQVVVDDDRFAEFAKSIVPLCTVTPSDARVEVLDGVVKLTPSVDGSGCDARSLRDQLARERLAPSGVTHTVVLTAVKPTVDTAAATQLQSRAQALVSRSLSLQLLGGTYTPDRATIASWLLFSPDPDTKQPTVLFSDDAITKYLQSIEKNIYIAPGQTVISMSDGVEAGRVIGVNGRGVAMTDAIADTKSQLLAGDGVVTLQATVLQPTIRYSRSYSKSQAGLQALLNDLVAQNGDYAISVRQLGGSGWTADARGGVVYTPASTYKLFVAYATLKRIESGQMQWGDQAASGRTVAACFDAMIVNSDNACAEWFGATIGWKVITDMIRSIGLSAATSLNTPRGFIATANDEALFLAKLQAGQLLSPDSTSRLLDVMKRQVYRSGIPAGVGVTVADKVGFLDGLLHDAAIVYAPSGTYALVIFSNDSSWSQIASVASQIQSQLQ